MDTTVLGLSISEVMPVNSKRDGNLEMDKPTMSRSVRFNAQVKYRKVNQEGNRRMTRNVHIISLGTYPT